MNAPLRRAGVVIIVLFGLLFVNLNWVQAYRADSYRTNEHNARVLYSEYERQRGNIQLADGTVLAVSTATNDNLKYLRTYPLNQVYAQIIGYRSVNGGSAGVERSQNDFLSGNAPALFGDRFKEMFTGDKTPGGNVIVTLSKAAQQAAFTQLTNNKVGAKSGAAVAIDPVTGGLLAMVSLPSFDPNTLTQHDTDAAGKAYDGLESDPKQPLLNRAIQGTYPPGSTMKVIVSAAALSTGQYTPQTVIPAGESYTPVAGGGFTIHNAEDEICPGATISLIDALTQSCNTGFAHLGVTLGADKLKDMARAFGFENDDLTLDGSGNLAIRVAASRTGDMTGQDGQDDPNAVAQSSIGQLDVRETPLQDAMVAAAVANNGVLMRPYIVNQLQAPDLTIADTTQPKALGTPVSPQVAGDLQQMMESVVAKGTGRKAQIPGYRVGGKTGTAQNASDAGDHGWFIGYVLDKNNKPLCAVAVFLEKAGPGGSGEAARIAGEMMKAVIAERGAK
jgi:peptidoglycan glycosyltransferase